MAERNVYEQIIEWLDTHDGEMPRELKRRNGKRLLAKDLTSEEIEERELFKRWSRSFEYKALMECTGIPLDKLPQQYAKYREQIANLRSYGLINSVTYTQVLEWLETHNGNFPRTGIEKARKRLSVEEMTDEEREEVKLNYRWKNSPEFKALQECKGLPLDKLPKKYVAYREQITILRSYKAGLRNYKKSNFEQILEWLETHEGKFPRSGIVKNYKHLKIKEMTPEEHEEVNLSHRWQHSNEYKAFRDCKGIPLEQLPSEYKQYKEQIEALRKYEQMRKDNKLKGRMKKSVGKQVENNSKVRQEIVEVARSLDSTAQEREALDGK